MSQGWILSTGKPTHFACGRAKVRPPVISTPEGIRQWIVGDLLVPVPEKAGVRIILRFVEAVRQQKNCLLLP
jgi:hypothetical protein